MVALGSLYERGLGLPKDSAKALALYRKAAVVGRAAPRKRQSQPIVANGGRRRSICRIRRAGAAIALRRAPSTSCLRNSADCPVLGGSRDLVQLGTL
ncbi:MAG: SEL1-like repeat protein [Candidatus Kaistia colombiensis]|nr:MAG: SEL1-like repeat protein [Kaistia sp.]